MPKKKNKVSKRTKKRKIKETKSRKKIISKESDLEEDIDEAENTLEESKFIEFLNLQEVSAPTLTKVLTQEPLEMNISSSPMLEVQETKPTNYTSSGESKYNDSSPSFNEENQQKYESEFRSPSLEPIGSRTQNQGMVSLREARGESRDDSPGIEMNALEQERREPFEMQERKYKETRI